MWDVLPLRKAGKPQHILTDWVQEANIWAVYPARLEASAKIRVCIEWLQQALSAQHKHVPRAATQ